MEEKTTRDNNLYTSDGACASDYDYLNVKTSRACLHDFTDIENALNLIEFQKSDHVTNGKDKLQSKRLPNEIADIKCSTNVESSPYNFLDVPLPKKTAFNFLDVPLPCQKSFKNISFANESSSESELSISHGKTNESDMSLLENITAKVLSHSIQFNHSYKSLEANAKLINSTPGAKLRIPDTIYRIKKTISPVVPTEFYIKCERCNEYSSTRSDQTECVSCLSILKRAHSQYFVYLPLKPQLEKSINEHFEDILTYEKNDKFCKNDNIIYDIQNSIQYKRAKEKFPDAIILPLVVNTDGAQLFNSGKKSIWPLQIIQNFLHPTIRYLPQNIIVTAIYEGHPDDMKYFFYPMLKELEEMYNEGGFLVENHGVKHRFLPLILQCSMDLPAKKDVQNMIGPNGYYGCGYCLQKGVPVRVNKNDKSHVRMVHEENPLLRTHENLLKIYEKIKSIPIYGVTGTSCMIAAKQFDLINGFSIDYMHCVLLGIMRKLFDLWLNSKHHKKPFYINKKKQVILDQRLLKIKPTIEITRKPRTIDERADYKANELRSLLLYYLRYCLVDLLPQRYITHFQLLSAAVYMLLEEEITLENVSLAETKLVNFVKQYEQFYGESNVTMNVHLLRHLAKSVQQLGPLWAQSTFAFETNNGTLVHSRHAKNHCLQQMAWKYSTRVALRPTQKKCTETILDGKKSTIEIETEDMKIFSDSGFDVPSKKFMVYYSITFKGMKVSSKKSKVVSTIDYFIECRNSEIGAVLYYFTCADGTFAFIELYAIQSRTDHLIEIKAATCKKVINIEEIAFKLLYMKIREKEIVTKIPNRYEKT